MLYSPYSEQMFFVSIFSPPFAAAYADTVSRPSSLIIEQMLMIFPCPFSFIPGITALETMNGAFRSTSMTFLNSSASISSIGFLMMIPALFTRISMIPTSSLILATIAFTCASSVTSHTYPCASIPASLYAASPKSTFSCVISLKQIVAPASAYAEAIPNPIP